MVKDSKITGRSAGHTVKTYKIGVDDVPDWVYPEGEKKKAYEKWVTRPKAENNVKMMKEGRSRYFGDWHDTGGLVFDEFDDKYHLVDPFVIPDSWTRYRAVDHGSTNPTACLWAAVSPEGVIYLYREYYMAGLEISENVRRIVEASCNKLLPMGLTKAGKGVFYERFNESFDKERYHKTVLDSRSSKFKDTMTQLDIGKLYSWSGLRTTQAAGFKTEVTIPVVKDLLTAKLDKETGEVLEGYPRIRVFRNLANFLNEIRGYAYQEFKSSKVADESNQKETPIKKNDHLMTALIYLSMIPPRHIKGKWGSFTPVLEKTEEEEEAYDRKRENRFIKHDPYTGY